MKKLFYLFAALLISQSILAQNPLYQWAKHLGTYTSNTYALSHAVDADGNVYITGYFDGTADFNPGTGVSELTLAGNSDIFVCKLDASGSFVWAKSFGSTGIDKGNDIAVNASGVYVIGNYEGTVDFDPGAGVTNLSGNGIFVCKLDASGNLSWVKKFGNSDSEDGSGIALDGSGNVFITGEFFFTDDFDPGAGTANLTSAGQSDIFICKLDASGNYQWAKRFGGNNFDSANNIVTDASGGVYTTASFQATADFGAGSGISNLTSAGDYDFVICKLDNSGNYVWVKQIGGTGGDFGSGITVDASGNVYTTGGFSGTVDFDPGAGTANLTRQTVANGLFVTKLDIDGNYVWAQKIDGATISEGIIRSLAITSSSSGIYITGYLNGGMDVNPGPASNVLTSSSFSEDILIFKWDFEGNYLWAKAMGGSLTDHSYKISVSSGDIYINGTFQSLNVDFDPGLGTANLTKEPNPASTKTNGFIAKYTDCIPVSTPTGTITWTGSVGTAWNDACNWSPATVPGAGNAVVIPNTANDPIISSFTANVSRIDIQSGGQLTVSNTGILNVTQFTVTGIYLDGAALTNNGTINLTSNDDNVSEITLLSGSTVNNSGIINLNRGFGITNSSGATFTNNACGKVIFADASNNDFRNSGTVTNDGLIQIFWWLHNSGNITNNGVLKYETLNSTGGTLTNNRIIIDDDDSPIFQLGASNNATVNGIYTNQGASNSAGTYTQATNTFTPSGLLPGGTQTLYAKITPNGGACIYVVPFLYTNNIPLPVITSDPVSTSRCSGASASFSITATGAQSYRWQVSTNGGGAWANVPNSAPYSNVTSATLNISNVTGLNNNQYRCAAINLGGTVESNAATLTIISTTSAPTGTITWNGSVSTDWSTACNWTPASVPGTGNSVAIPDAANDPVIGANVTVLYVDIQTNAQLTVNSGASLTTTAGFDYGINLGNGSTFTNNGTTTVQESTNATAFFTTNATATINNNGTLTVGAAETAFSPFTGSSMTVNNTVNATITVNGTASGFSTLNTGTLQLTNHGSIIYNGPSRIFSGVKGSIVNNGLIRATSGTGVLLYAPSTLTNATCAQFILTTGDYFSDPGTTTTNNGYFYVAGQLYNNAFVNNGVLKYGSLSSTITNTAASAVIVNNSVPIFTYGGSYNGTVNGIFKDAAATLSAGTFTAPNTFVSSGLPGGAQTLYAKITPSGGSCNYVVPFTYIANANPTITAAAAVTRQQSSPGLLADIATVNDAETPAGSLTVTATTVPANITVTNITNVSGTIRATITANCFATIGANTLVLTVTDANGGIATTNFTVNVTANTPPTLTYNNAFLSQGAGGTILPATGPSDNEGAQVFLQSVSPSPSPATITVNNITGAVTIPNTIPVGIYTITVVATDVCTTDVAVPITLSVQSADYTITTTGGNVVITDVTGSGETLDITESSGNIRFNVTGKTYKIDGGVTTPFTTPADVPLSGKTSITVNTAVGNDIINVGTFSTQLPSLTVNGGTGDDAVNFNGDITFVTNANLDVDLQNDDAAPGSDAVSFAADANVILSGSGTATLKVSQNITFNSGSSLETVNGNLTLEANQQTTASTGSFIGVQVNAATVRINGTGILNIRGKSANGQPGVSVDNAGLISGGTNGTVTIEGTAGTSTGGNKYGMFVANSALITSSGANVSIIGSVAGTSIGGQCIGVNISTGGTISAGGSGTVTVQGTGGESSGHSNYGILVTDANSQITSSGGNVSVTGQGGNGTGNSIANHGLRVESFGRITAGGNGTVTVQGTGGALGKNSNHGVSLVFEGAQITSNGGNVYVTGQGGGTGVYGDNWGISVSDANAQITAGGSGTVTVHGTGGRGAGFCYGVRVEGQITSNGGNVSVTGMGGELSTSSNNCGVYLEISGKITAGNSGTVTVHGTGGTGSGPYNCGVGVVTDCQITSNGGDVSVTGIEGTGSLGLGIITANGIITTATNGGNITLIANSMDLGGPITTNNSGITTLRQYTNNTPINLGIAADAVGGPLSLTDDELDRITTGTLIMGNLNSGNLTVSANITRPAGTHVQLVSGGDVTISGGGFNTGGGTLLLDPGTSPAAVKPAFNGIDVTASTLSFAGNLQITFNGTVAGDGTGSTYSQLKVAGALNLTGVALLFDGTYVPVAGNTFIIIDNDASDNITGTFNGLAQGATIPNFRGSGLNATISYTGGDGNDVVISLQAFPEINLKGNGVDIANGDNTPVITDHTDFGPVSVPSGSITRTFTIENANTATGNLVLGTNPVSISGNADFTITQPALTTVPAGGSTTFTVTFDPSAAGLRTAAISIANNDADESPYTFAIEGYGGKPFITTWATAYQPGSANNGSSITIPTTGSGYNYDVDWDNDGQFDEFGLTGSVTHDYGIEGTYTVAIRGNFPQIYFNNTGDKGKILSINQWGDIAWRSMKNAFYGCINLTEQATDAPDLSGVTNINQMFVLCKALNQDINNWNTSTITDMGGVFIEATAFNQNLNNWGTQNVTNMAAMFWNAKAFNGNITNWNTEKVTTMNGMFLGAEAFNQPIGNWKTQNVTDMYALFKEAIAFNQSIGGWDTQNVTDMGSMFSNAVTFNQPLSGWKTQNVTSMVYMFDGASSFNQDIGNWQTGAVNYMYRTFAGATAFNQNISGWDVSYVTEFSNMFKGATVFNQNLGSWNIGAATGMTDMLTNSGLSLTNYDNTLIGWNNGGYTNKNLGDASPLQYCAAQSARSNMITNKGWSITGDSFTNACLPADYSITTTGGNVVITDVTGTGETLDVSQSGSNIRFSVTGKTYSIDGGAITAFTTPADVALAGKTSITINAGNGSDIINVGAFSSNLPSLTINGGTGDDQVNMNGDIVFASNANLDLDLQNDDAAPGTDAVLFASGTNINLQGTGTATIKVSKNVIFNTGSTLITVNGNLTVEANQQVVPTSGNFIGVLITGTNTQLQTTPNGTLTVKGRGGDDASGNQQGIKLAAGGRILGGEGANAVTVAGTGGTSGGNGNHGVLVTDANSSIFSLGGPVSVTGTGGGSGASGVNVGVRVLTSGEITSAGGTVTVVGQGGLNVTGNSNSGISVQASGKITSNETGGNVTITGTGGGSGSSAFNEGIFLADGELSAGGLGTVDITGQGGAGTGISNNGLSLEGLVTSKGGSITLTGKLGGGSLGTYGIYMSKQMSAPVSSILTNVHGGNISIITNSFRIVDSPDIRTTAAGSVTIKPFTAGREISIFSGFDGVTDPLMLSDLELDRVSTGTLIIGDANSGNITVSQTVTRPSSTNVQLISGGDVTISGGGFNTNGGTLLLDPGTSPKAVKPIFNGTDVTATTLSFAGDLQIALNGTTLGDGTGNTYSQLNVVGALNLTGVNLLFDGTYVPVGGETFTIVNNDGSSDAITGTFIGLAQGATIPNFLGSSLSATIVYNGGDGNDVVITVQCAVFPAPTASVTIQPTCTTPTGTIVITAPTGTDIQYSVGGAYQSETTFAGLAPAVYQVTAKNTATGCVSNALPLTVNAVPANPATPTASVTVQPTCLFNTGTIVITAPTGTDIQYSVGGAYQSETTFAGLAPAVYQVTAKNTATGCVSTALPLTVNAVPANPATPTASVTVQPTCLINTGTIVITAPTGTDIQYSVGGAYQSETTFAGLAPAVYQVTAKNTATGCISTALPLTVTAVPNAPAVPTASVTAQPTCSTPTGTIVVTDPTGTDIHYSVGGAYQSETTFSGLAPNTTFQVTAKNTATGCISTALPLTVNAVPANPATPTASVTVQPTCLINTGTIVITAPTGTDIQYSTGGTYQSETTFAGLNPNATYQVTAKNTATGCISTALPLTVNAVPNAPATPTASVTIQPTCSTPTGTIVITAPTGTDIQYSTGGAYQSETTFAGLAPNTYQVTVRNTATGCISNALPLTVNAAPVSGNITVNFTGPNPVCQGSPTSLSVPVAGQWSSNDPAKATITGDGQITTLLPGTVTFTFTASQGCSAVSPILTIKPTPSSALTASQTDVCPNTTVTLDARCSIPTATVNWSPGGPTIIPAAATLPYVYKASCTVDGCTGNESSVEVRTHRILVDMKDLGAGVLPLPIVRAVKDNMAPTNLIEEPAFPRRWTFIANGCEASESAVFQLSGPVNFSTIDNAATYAMFANDGGGFYSLDHPNYGNGGSFPNGTYTLTVDLRSADGVGGPFPKNRVATGVLLATRTLQFTVNSQQSMAGRQTAMGERLTVEDGRRSAEGFAEVFPNPVSNSLRLKVVEAKGETINVNLIDASGRTLLHSSFIPESNQHQEEFEVSHLANGMYFLRIKTEKKQTVIKVIKTQ